MRQLIVASLLATMTLVALTSVTIAQEKKMKDVLVAPKIIDFKLIKVGKAGAQLISFANKGTSPVTIKSAKKIKAPYSLDGLKIPSTIAAGKEATFKLIFRRTKPEEYKGPISILLNDKGEVVITDSK